MQRTGVRASKNRKQSIVECVEMADCIVDESQRRFALAGIVAFSDKVITAKTKETVRRYLEMTQIGMMFEKEKEEAVAAVEKEKDEIIASERREKEEALAKLQKAEALNEAIQNVAEALQKERNLSLKEALQQATKMVRPA